MEKALQENRVITDELIEKYIRDAREQQMYITRGKCAVSYI